MPPTTPAFLLPDVARGLDVAIGERSHRTLQHAPGLVPQLQHVAYNLSLGNVMLLARRRLGVHMDCDMRELSAAQRLHAQDILRDARRAIANALQVANNREYRGQVAQITPAQRLLEG